MLFNRKAKLEKVASKDPTRPVLCSLHLTVAEHGQAFLEATDSYSLVRVPVELEEGDEAGYIPSEALKAARKATYGGGLEVNGSIVDKATGQTWPRQDIGQWPNFDSLIGDLDELWKVDGLGEPFELGLDARKLAAVQEAMGADSVRLSLFRGRGGSTSTAEPETDPSVLRPIVVRPLTGGGEAGSIGLVMPVKVSR